MTQPNDFGLDLATRIALHEILLEKLFYEVINDHPDPDRALRTLRASLNGSFEPAALNSGLQALAPEQKAFVDQQSAWGKRLSDNFVDKVERMLQPKGSTASPR